MLFDFRGIRTRLACLALWSQPGGRWADEAAEAGNFGRNSDRVGLGRSVATALVPVEPLHQ